jgi:hypothetical protein
MMQKQKAGYLDKEINQEKETYKNIKEREETETLGSS